MQQNTGQVVQPAPVGTCATYERRRPEETVLYQLVAEHLESFLAQVEAETAAHLVDEVIPQVPVRQWVLSFPIPLRFLLAAHPQLLSPVLKVINRAISTFLTKQAGLKCTEAQTGAVTLIQRFGSAANLNRHA